MNTQLNILKKWKISKLPDLHRENLLTYLFNTANKNSNLNIIFQNSLNIIQIFRFTIPPATDPTFIYRSSESLIHRQAFFIEVLNHGTSCLHTEKSFRNLSISNRNQSENGKYNLISVWFDKISKWFLCLYKMSNTREHVNKCKCIRTQTNRL